MFTKTRVQIGRVIRKAEGDNLIFIAFDGAETHFTVEEAKVIIQELQVATGLAEIMSEVGDE